MEIVKDHFTESMGRINELKKNVEDIKNTISTMEKALSVQDEILQKQNAEIQRIEGDIAKAQEMMNANSYEICLVEHIERQVQAQQMRLTRHAEFWKMFQVLSKLPLPYRQPKQRRIY